VVKPKLAALDSLFRIDKNVGLNIYSHLDLSRIEKDLTIKHKYNPEISTCLFENTDKFFSIPIGYAISKGFMSNAAIDFIEDRRAQGDEVKITFTRDLWEGQQSLISEVTAKIAQGATNFILNAKPGSGKTVCAIKLLSMLGRRAIVIVPRSNLVWQWAKEVENCTNLQKDEIGYIEGGNRYFEPSAKIVIALVHSLARISLSPEFISSFGVSIFDEVHSTVPPSTFCPVVGLFHPKYRISMSATLNRQDGMDKVFLHHFGECLIKAKVAERVDAKVIVHFFNHSSGTLPAYIRSKKIQAMAMLLSKLVVNKKRNDLILKYIISCHNSKRKTLILSDRVQHLLDLKKMLLGALKLSEESIGMYMRSIPYEVFKDGSIVPVIKRITLSKKEEERIIKECDIIFATYQMFDLGTDIKDLAAVIYATPRSASEQSRGRVERKCEGKKQPVVIDIVDTMHVETRIKYKNRLREYNSTNLDIRVVGNDGSH
jgi:superfamily II DNA or RNA helicase